MSNTLSPRRMLVTSHRPPVLKEGGREGEGKGGRGEGVVYHEKCDGKAHVHTVLPQ